MLEKHRLFEKIFTEINRYLEEKELLMKAGTIVDATLIAAPSSTKTKMKKRDAEMSSTKKSGKWHFGMKDHIGVDSNSGIVHSLIDNLLHGQEKAILGDIAKLSFFRGSLRL